MRSTFLKIVLCLSLGLVTAAATACEYHASTAANGQASTTETAQAQPPVQDESN
jgi:hypothetical protein